MANWVGLDLGTSSLKAVAVDASGHVRARSVQTYSSHVVPGEQDPAAWEHAAARALEECRTGGAVAAIGLTGQVPTLVAVDAHGAPVRPASTWQDTRAQGQATELAAHFGTNPDLFGFDFPWAASQMPAKLAWLSHSFPADVERAAWFLQPKDYLGLLLTGEAASDAWSMKGVVRVPDGQVLPEVFDAVGWSASTCPPILPAAASRGRTRDGALGLPGGIPVTVGFSDALASMLALGALTRPEAFIISGTSDVVGLTGSWGAVTAPGLYSVPAGVAPETIVYGPTQSSGASLEWVARLLELDVPQVLELAAGATRADTPTFVPYLDGERAPIWRSDIRAVIAGVGRGSGRAELARAVVEGVGSAARHILESASRATGATYDVVRMGGRGREDAPGLRMRATAVARPLLLLTEPYVAAYGAAMLAAVMAADGDWEASAALEREFLEIEPEEGDAAFARYLTTSRMAETWTF